MITTAGTSSYSLATIFKTLYVKSELGMFRDSLGLKEFNQRIEKNSRQIDDNQLEMVQRIDENEKTFNKRIEKNSQQIDENIGN